MTRSEVWRLWLLSFFTAINILIIGLALEAVSPHSFRFYNFVKYYPYEIGALCLLFVILATFRLLFGSNDL